MTFFVLCIPSEPILLGLHNWEVRRRRGVQNSFCRKAQDAVCDTLSQPKSSAPNALMCSHNPDLNWLHHGSKRQTSTYFETPQKVSPVTDANWLKTKGGGKKKLFYFKQSFSTATRHCWSATFDRDAHSSLSPSGAKHSKVGAECWFWHALRQERTGWWEGGERGYGFVRQGGQQADKPTGSKTESRPRMHGCNLRVTSFFLLWMSAKRIPQSWNHFIQQHLPQNK